MSMKPYSVGTDHFGAVSYAPPISASKDYVLTSTDEEVYAIPTFNGDKPQAMLVVPNSGVDIYITDDSSSTADSIVTSGDGHQMLITGRTLVKLDRGSTHLHIKCFSQPAVVNVGWYGPDSTLT